jgi:ribosomal protein S18 acetylase RimI-like enzyme
MPASEAQFHPVTQPAEIDRVINLAQVIWPQHYAPIIGAAQVRYMLDTYHSRAAINEELATKGYSYFLVQLGGRDVGYLAVQPQADNLYLSKVYILSSERGKGLGRQSLAFAKAEALRQGLRRMTLIVNKGNTGTIAAYQRIGFVKTREVRADIGQGFVMDDIAMEWQF